MAIPSQTSTTTAAADAKPTTHIRAATKDDAAAISALGAHVFSATFGHSVPPHELDAYLTKEYSPAAIAADLANPAKNTIVAVDASSGEVLGFAVLTRGTSEPCIDALANKVELQRIYVHPKAHGRGLGRALATKLEAMARDEGFASIWLGVWEENLSAQKAYEKWGYERVGEHDFVIGTVAQTDYILVKKL
ncbi:hypothetical protein MPH_07407 [Macrophomina phaseolina MS6]|uniref:N-acetyltransferase domain-containing protein n=1 Tax=Macrophomina phaseolina (strain MS6) TaxID=1126212 RepID=K2QZD6_MACPH|nr:hypothetical protein MPH_07407 [Macrophomina phaseolina MS6]